MSNPSSTCPKCGLADEVTSVSTVSADNRQNSVGRMLAPPSKPQSGELSLWSRYSGVIFILGGVCSILTASIVILPAISQGTFDSQFIQLSLSMLFGLGIIGAGIATFRSNNKKSRRRKAQLASQLAQWEMAMSRWQRLYYCARDEGVFDPKEQVFVPAERMIDYLES